MGQSLKEQLYEKQTGNKWDGRNKLEIYKDLKKINNAIVVKVSPIRHLNKNYSVFPLSGISNSETIYCNENGYYSIYQSDRYGFNNPDTEWDKKEIEYLLIGDSFAHGACVNRPHDIASVLRNLSNKPSLNLGYSANGPLIEYATLREYLPTNIKKVAKYIIINPFNLIVPLKPLTLNAANSAEIIMLSRKDGNNLINCCGDFLKPS